MSTAFTPDRSIPSSPKFATVVAGEHDHEHDATRPTSIRRPSDAALFTPRPGSDVMSEKQDPLALEAQTGPQGGAATPAEADSQHNAHPLAQMSAVRKNILLLLFSVAVFVDICNVSGVGVAVAQIALDIKLDLSQVVWIITSYSLCFAAFLLFAGRLADLFPATIVFEAGFILLGVISLVTSFVTTNKFGFLILRGIGGICGALTVPSSYHLAVHMFPEPEEQKKKLALLGISGAVGNVLGLVLAGVTMLASYHWFFRLMAIICILFGGLTVVLLPYVGSSYIPDGTPRWKRLDFIGVILMMGALITFILSLTQGPIDGWGSASFIAPFVLAFPLGVAFFFWESRIPARSAVLPSSVWKITNIIIASLAVMVAFPFWATSQLQFANYFQYVLGWSPIHVAAAMVPQGIICLVWGALSQMFPAIISKARITIAAGSLMIIAAELLQIYSDGGHGYDYWRYLFPGYLLGSSGATLVYFASGINLITYCPPEMAGVASAWVQVLAQVGGAITLAVQAGLQGDNIFVWREGPARGFWFMLAWTAVLGGQFVLFYKTPGSVEEEHAAARKRIEETIGETGV